MAASLSLWLISVTVLQSVHVPTPDCLYTATGFSDIRGDGNSKIWMPGGCAVDLSVSINKTWPERQLRSHKPLARKGECCLAVGAVAGSGRKIHAGISILKGGAVLRA